MTEIIGISIYVGIALGLGLAFTLGFGIMLHAGSLIRKEPLPLLFFAIIIAIMAAPIATGRLLTAGLAVSEASFEEIGSSFWLTRVLTLGVLILCAERFFRFFLHREWTSVHSWGLFWAFVAFAISNQILNGIFGATPSFNHKVLYAFLIYFSVFLVAQSQPERCFRFARVALLMFFVVSILVAVVKPGLVIEKGYLGGIPGIPFRYYGLATHANTMGPLTVVFMICLWRFPFRSRWVNLFSWFLASTSLILTQSKTTIFVAIVIGLFLMIYRYQGRIVQSFRGGRSSLLILITACVCFTLSLAILAAWLGADVVGRMIYQVDQASGGGVTTLTGRTNIWTIAWKEFLANPLFGYGPSIWGYFYRLSIGMNYAYSAHNQLLQSLSSAGLVGAAGLIFYASMLVIYALRAAPLSGGISVALVGLMLFRSFTEIPFATSNAMQSEFFMHLLALVACIGFLPAKQSESARPAFAPAVSGTMGTTMLAGTSLGRPGDEDH
ncbi:MAG: O-antigen ligase family protein [Gammaproteobacteria bacterium]|nr:O-antigen ligase family protein [Gammaproteobacteria bacterium]